jgi:hypothetical protein
MAPDQGRLGMACLLHRGLARSSATRSEQAERGVALQIEAISLQNAKGAAVFNRRPKINGALPPSLKLRRARGERRSLILAPFAAARFLSRQFLAFGFGEVAQLFFAHRRSHLSRSASER